MPSIKADPCGTQITDENGRPLVGGAVYFYEAGTTTPRTIYADPDLTVSQTNPLLIGGNGFVPYGYVGIGKYRYRVVKPNGVPYADFDGIAGAVDTAPVLSGGGGGASFVTGQMSLWYSDQQVDGWVRCNGRTIGNATSGATERANDDCEALFLYLWTRDAGIGNLTVSSGRGANASGDWAAGKTITLPNSRGASIAVLDGFGNTATGRMHVSTTITTTLGSASAIVASSAGLTRGMYVIGSTVTAGTTVTAIDGVNITLSAPAAANGTASPVRFSLVRDPQVLGSYGGSPTFLPTVSELIYHNHLATAANAGAHAHTATAAPAGTHVHTGTTNGVVDHVHNYNNPTAPQASYTAGSTASAVASYTSASTGSAGGHSHSFTTSAAPDHTHSLSIDPVADHTHVLTVIPEGGGNAMPTLPPTFTVGLYIRM